jgi:uncharacterized membrane protein YccC
MNTQQIQMAFMNIASTFSGTLAAIIVISGVIAKIRPVGAALKRFAFAELYAANEKQDKRLDKLEMQQLKQIICDRRLPTGDRLNAGEEYTGRGGNGEIKMICESLHEMAKKKQIEEQERLERGGRERRGEP